MATTTYRFVGAEPEVFPDYSAAFTVAGRQDDPNAADFQQPGELRPGQEFEGPAGVEHVRIERKARNGRWVATVDAEPEPVQQDEQGHDPAPAAGSTSVEVV